MLGGSTRALVHGILHHLELQRLGGVSSIDIPGGSHCHDTRHRAQGSRCSLDGRRHHRRVGVKCLGRTQRAGTCNAPQRQAIERSGGTTGLARRDGLLLAVVRQEGSDDPGRTLAGECSSTAIRALIKKLVAAENPRKPLSDSKITQLLEEQGIKVARRTIAKYRDTLFIPPSNERKRLV